MTAILLAAGYGTRLQSLFPGTPKALIEIGGKTILDYLIDNLFRSKMIDSVTLITNERFLKAFSYHLASKPPKLPVRLISDGTSTDQTKIGALGDLNLALDQLDKNDDVIVTSTDRVFGFEFAEPLRFAKQQSAPINVCTNTYRRANIIGNYGCVLLGSNQRIIDFEEKPQQPRSTIASLSVYVLPVEVQPLLKAYLLEQNNHDATGFFLRWLIKQTSVYAFVTNQRSYDVGTPKSYAVALRAFSNQSLNTQL